MDSSGLINCPTRLPLEEAFIRFKLLEKKHKRLLARLKQSQAEARDFADMEILPIALELDEKVGKDTEFYDWDITRKGMERGFLTYMFPTFIGGEGRMLMDLCLMLEELCCACGGVGLLFGAHWLGVGGMLMSFDMEMYYEIFKSIVEGKKRGEPILCAAAVTEPMAGSDVEDRDDIKNAKLISTAKKVEGGYAINCHKVFISDGSVATWTAITAALDKDRPQETYTGFVVNKNWTGFSVGRWEKKMGQKASPAAELILEDVFVPEKFAGTEGHGMDMTIGTLCASRGPLGAISTGIARGAFERAWLYAMNNKSGGQRLIDKQWVQMKLAQMLILIQQSRQVYMDAAMAMEVLNFGVIHPAPAWISKPAGLMVRTWLNHYPGSKIMRTEIVSSLTKRFREKYFATQGDPDRERIVAKLMVLASIAKVSGADTAVEVSRLAMDIAGHEAPIREIGLEKCLRDAKLCQIYEGTNQLNRATVIKYALDLDKLGVQAT